MSSGGGLGLSGAALSTSAASIPTLGIARGMGASPTLKHSFGSNSELKKKEEPSSKSVPRHAFLEAQMAVAGLMASEPWEEFTALINIEGTALIFIPKPNPNLSPNPIPNPKPNSDPIRTLTQTTSRAIALPHLMSLDPTHLKPNLNLHVQFVAVLNPKPSLALTPPIDIPLNLRPESLSKLASKPCLPSVLNPTVFSPSLFPSIHSSDIPCHCRDS